MVIVIQSHLDACVSDVLEGYVIGVSRPLCNKRHVSCTLPCATLVLNVIVEPTCEGVTNSGGYGQRVGLIVSVLCRGGVYLTAVRIEGDVVGVDLPISGICKIAGSALCNGNGKGRFALSLIGPAQEGVTVTGGCLEYYGIIYRVEIRVAFVIGAACQIIRDLVTFLGPLCSQRNVCRSCPSAGFVLGLACIPAKERVTRSGGFGQLECLIVGDGHVGGFGHLTAVDVQSYLILICFPLCSQRKVGSRCPGSVGHLRLTVIPALEGVAGSYGSGQREALVIGDLLRCIAACLICHRSLGSACKYFAGKFDGQFVRIIVVASDCHVVNLSRNNTLRSASVVIAARVGIHSYQSVVDLVITIEVSAHVVTTRIAEGNVTAGHRNKGIIVNRCAV